MDYLKKIFNFKIFVTKPKQNKILVYDSVSEKFANILFSKNSYSFYDVRFESINIYVLLKTFFNSGLSNLITNYKLNYFRFVNPKIIYTSIDNNIGFYRLKKIFPKAYYISDQNGIRDNKFFLDCKKFLKNGTEKLVSDIFFCFGNNDKKKIHQIIKTKIFILGNTKNNQILIKKNDERIKKIIFISTGAKHTEKIDNKIFSYLIKFSEMCNYKLYFLDKPKKKRENLIRKKFKGKFNYHSSIKFFDNYKIMKKDALIVFAASTLGYEAFSKGLRCVSFDHSKYHYDYKYPKSGPFWGELKNFQSLKHLINKVLNYDKLAWRKIHAKYSKNILFFDQRNSQKRILIKQLLRGNFV
jgi:hypothetical protein